MWTHIVETLTLLKNYSNEQYELYTACCAHIPGLGQL